MSWELRLGDCLDPVTGLASLPDKSVDHVICDPPYEIEAHTKQRRTQPHLVGKAWAGAQPVHSIELGFTAMTDDLRKNSATHLARVARRWIIVFCQVEAVTAWRDSLSAAGAAYKRACIWVKPDAQPQLTGDRPGTGYESIVAAHAPGRTSWNGAGRPGVYVFHRQESGDSTRGVAHPAKKPLALMNALVRDFTDAGELIADPFAGSGTTGVAAITSGRRFIGWEQNPKHHAVAIKRLQLAREQLAMFGGAA